MAIQRNNIILLDSRIWLVSLIGPLNIVLTRNTGRRILRRIIPREDVVELPNGLPNFPNIDGAVRGRALSQGTIGGPPHIGMNGAIREPTVQPEF